MALFEITRRGSRQNRSLVAPAAVAQPFGTAFQQSAAAVNAEGSNLAELADGTKPFDGFVTRGIITALPGPTYADMGMGQQPLEQDFLAGYEVGLEDADQYQAEGAYLYSGTGQITSATALKTKCSFRDGKTVVAQTGQYAEYMLIEKLTPEVATNNVRGRFERIRGVIV